MIHPIIVHFPIALLTLYAVFELLRFKKLLGKSYWMHIKAILVIFGAVGAAAAYATGPDVHGAPLVEMHSNFATATLIIYGIIALHYLFLWLREEGVSRKLPSLPSSLVVLLALIGLISVTITGALGGAIVYGTHFDPFMAPIFKLLNVY